MQRTASLPPCGHTFVAQLKSCAKIQDLSSGLRLHANVAASGLLESNPFVGSSLVDMYVKCGSLAKARQVFDKLPRRDVVCWTAIISGYVEYGHGEQALDCLSQMQMEGVSPNCVTFVCCLKACGLLQDPTVGQQIHAEIDRQGLMESNPILGNSLVDMYSKCGLLSFAKQVFDNLPIKDIVSQTALITGYAEHGYRTEALEFFEQMKHEGMPSDSIMLVCCLKAFGIISALDKGCELHAEIESKGLLGRDVIMDNSLVDMFVKFGLLSKAREVFDKLPIRNVVSWNVLIAGYGECGNGQEALDCLALMQLEGVASNALTVMFSLKACGVVNDIEKCHELHLEIEKRGFSEGESPFASTLIDVYAKCKDHTSAQSVFDKLLVRDVVSWTALIAGYSEQGHCEQALLLFEKMQLEGVSPSAVTYVCAMRVCGTLGAIEEGKGLHMNIMLRGLLEQDLAVGNALIDMYVKCSCLTMAQVVFNKLPFHSVVTWATLIAGYIENGYGKEAFDCLEQMLHQGVSHNLVTCMYGLQACGITGDILRGIETHSEVERQGLIDDDLTIGSAVVEMYASCGLLSRAKESLDRLQAPDILSWNALIAGYFEHGTSEEAINCFKLMQEKGVSPNAATYAHYLEVCCNTGALICGQKVHNEVEIRGLLEEDVLLASTLVDMYAKCGQLSMAQQVFNKLKIRDVVSWTALIAGYVDHHYSREALLCLAKMQLEGVLPNAITLVLCMKACVRTKDTDKGQQIHAEIERRGLLQDVILGNVVVDLYIKSGWLGKAQEVFERLPARDMVSWTTCLAGYVEQGYNQQAILFFDKMQAMGVLPSAITFLCVLKACSRLGDMDRGKEIHYEIDKHNLLGSNVAIGNSLVYMYAKGGSLAKAQQLFDSLPVRNADSWAALITGYTIHGCDEEALECFEQMQFKGIYPNSATLVCILRACGRVGGKDKGYAIHAEVERYGLAESNLSVSNALIGAYANSGWFAEAQKLLHRLPTRDVVSWNSLMAGYAQLGQSEEVLACFDKMQEEHIKPDLVTFSVVLKACSREGLARKSQMYFEAMSRDYGIIPTVGHHVYIIDVLGHTGQINKAASMIEEVQSCHSFVVWHTLLRASRKWGSLWFAKHAFEHSVNLDEGAALHHCQMHSEYANGDQLEVLKKIRQAEDARKNPPAWDIPTTLHNYLDRNTTTVFQPKLVCPFKFRKRTDYSSLVIASQNFFVNANDSFAANLYV